MKKVLNKLTRRSSDEPPTRITNNTIDEHREAVLSKGRKFKYPIQYARYKLVINTVILSIAALVVIGIIGWVQLYRVQNTGNIIYNITKVLPLHVAKVDGKGVLYSDYLMQLRSSLAVIERQEGQANIDKGQIEYYKRIALDNSILNTFVMKLANELDIKIDQDRINTVFNEHRTSGGTMIDEQNFIRIIRDNYGLSRAEYERMFIELPLLKREVQIRIDDEARATVEELQQKLNPDGSNFDLVTGEFADRIEVESSGGLVSATNLDGGRAAKAYSLNIGEVSAPFLSKSGDSYYVVKLVSKENEKVEYVSIRIALTELQLRLDQLRADGLVKEFIVIGTPDGSV